jgi:riboflavin kinase/FMN adenylyltransferase
VSSGSGAGDEVFSSTAAREALAAGDPARAAAILGGPFVIEGRVARGDRRGRTIGFPTANLWLGEYVRPRFGVYAVRVDLGGGVRCPGVANLGLRPTFGGDAVPRLEVHLFDFAGDLYGRRVCVELVGFLRPEQRFEGLDALKAQIAADAAQARAALSAGCGDGVPSL